MAELVEVRLARCLENLSSEERFITDPWKETPEVGCASEDELTRRRRDGDDGGDRDDARTNDDQAGIEQARTAAR